MAIVKVDNLGQLGVVADQAPAELPLNAWTAASNIRFRDGYAERFRGQQAILTTPTITPYWVQHYSTTAARFLVYAGLTKVYTDNGTTVTEITGTAKTGAIDDRWTGGALNGVLITNNGVDKPEYSNGTSALATLTGWGATWKAASVRPFKNYLVALDVTKGATRYPHMVKWSHAAEPGTIPTSWDETDPSKDAGEVDLAETPGLMVDCLPLGDANIIYKEDGAWAQTYIGPPFIWRFQRLPGSYGLLARGCVVQTPKGHVALTPGDVVLHTGGEPQSILTARMRRWLFANMDSIYYKRSFVTLNPGRNEVWVCFPYLGDSTCTRALIWNWVDNTFGVRTLTATTYGATGLVNYSTSTGWSSDPETWAQDGSLWNQDEFSPNEQRLVLCQTTPALSQVDAGVTFNGSSVTASLERTGLHFDAPDRVKTIRSIFPRIEATLGTTIQIEVGSAMRAEEAPTYGSPVTFTVGTSRQVDAFASGRFLAVRFSSTSDQPWRMKAYEVDLIVNGRY
ncbi:MAG: hypothetical protein RJA34_1749 [Pseudomonadota bacterium]